MPKRLRKDKIKISTNDNLNQVKTNDNIIKHMDAKFDELSEKIDQGFKYLGGDMEKGFKDLKDILLFIAKKYGYDETIQKDNINEEKSKFSSNKRGENKEKFLSFPGKNEILDNNKKINLFDKEKSLESMKEEISSFDE